MDSYEATKIVFSRITTLDPENASKIMGLLLIQDHGEKEMIRLAFGPEAFLHSVILKARKDLGLMPIPSSPPTPSSPSPSPFLSSNPNGVSRQNSASSRLSLPIPNPSSGWTSLSSELRSQDESLMMSPNNNNNNNNYSNMPSSLSFFGNGGPDHVLEEFQLQEQLSFLNDGEKRLSSSPTDGSDQTLFSSSSVYGGGGGNWDGGCMDDPNNCGFGWKPCLYFARGYCKNGSSCRFVHGGELGSDGVGSPSKLETMDHEALLRSKTAQQQRLLNFLLLQQQTDAQRAAAALMMGDDIHKFSRSPRMERSEFAMMNGAAGMVNPASRQIYLTFPADSTFREQDVSNYFSIYGPVQDVRIPYQQKRMFGFVTFVYPETVKLILAKGNPHFVCDARVLVKPYKEKGKVHEKKQQVERGDLSPCGTPPGHDGRDPYDLQLGARMFYNSQDILWRRKLEEQAELQQALELQSRRLMGLQLLDVKKHHHRALSSSSPVHSPTQSPSMFSQNFVHPPIHNNSEVPQENCGSPPTNSSPLVGDQQLQVAATASIGKESSGNSDSCSGKESPPDEDFSALLGSVEHNLPESPFASPTKGARDYMSSFPIASSGAIDSSNASATTANANMATSLLPATSSLDMTSFKPFNCQIPRLSSGHGAIGMYAAGTSGPKCPVGTS